MKTKKQTYAPGNAEEVSMGLNSIIDNSKYWTPKQISDHALDLSGRINWRLWDASSDLLRAANLAADELEFHNSNMDDDCAAAESTPNAMEMLAAAIRKAKGK